jgi:hypothetical protein
MHFLQYCFSTVNRSMHSLSGVGPAPDGLIYFIQTIAIKTVGTLPDRRLAFFAGPKKVSKERTTPAAGISIFGVGQVLMTVLDAIRARSHGALFTSGYWKNFVISNAERNLGIGRLNEKRNKISPVGRDDRSSKQPVGQLNKLAARLSDLCL